MARPLVLIHGYSAEGTAFDPLHDALQKKGVNATDINICTYVSLNNEITIKGYWGRAGPRVSQP
jgi:uncharacterized alpha/beta hydrolase family protein